MTLSGDEFLRRFCLHILPPRFRKIRHYGFLSNRAKEKLRKQQLKSGFSIAAKQKLTRQEIILKNLNYDMDACPCCKKGKMIRLMSFQANAPPAIMSQLKNLNQPKQKPAA